MKNIKTNLIIFIILYIYFGIIFLLPTIVAILSIISIEGSLFCINIILIFILPILYLKNKINKIFIVICIILSINSLIGGFQVNEKISGNYSLINLGNKKYNFNLLNNFKENDLIKVGLNLSFLVDVTKENKNGFIDKLNEYQKININIPTQLANGLLNKKEEKYILYSPNNYNKDKIIFVLHGSCGLFSIYQKYFKDIGDKFGYQIVTPGFGWGLWNSNGGKEIIYNTYNSLLKNGNINKNTQVILIGISNGGTGLTQIIKSDNKNIFKKIIFISGFLLKKDITDVNFQNNIKNKEVYIIQGEKDNRVLYENYLKIKNYINVKKELIFKNGDHFLLLSEDYKVKNFINNILK